MEEQQGTSWEYHVGGRPFQVEITPEQASLLAELQDRFSLVGVITGESDPDLLERLALEKIPEALVCRRGTGVELSSSAQLALYEFIE